MDTRGCRGGASVNAEGVQLTSTGGVQRGVHPSAPEGVHVAIAGGATSSGGGRRRGCRRGCSRNQYITRV